MFESLLLLALLSLTLGCARLLRVLRGALAPPEVRLEMTRALATLVAGWAPPILLAGLVTVVALWVNPERSFTAQPPWDPHAYYALFLQQTPMLVQGGIGLLMVLFLGVSTVHLVRIHVSPWSQRALLAGAVVWAVVYGLLPFHLSAPDFDDFFVLGKFLGGIEPGWNNNKPHFILYDYLFRITDAFLPSEGRFIRFAVNGWLYVLYLANLLVFLKIVVSRRVEPVTTRGTRAVGFALAGGYLGLVVVSHSLFYALAGSTVLLLSFNVIESARTGRLGQAGAEVPVFWGLGGVALAIFSFNQLSAMWIPILIHGLVAAIEARAGRRRVVYFAALILAIVVIVFLQTRREMSSVGEMTDAFLLLYAGIALAAVGVAGKRLLAGAARTGPRGAFRSRLASFVILSQYAVLTYFLFIIPIYDHLEYTAPVFCISPLYWDHGTNHARYSSQFYPFMVAGAALILARIAASRRRTAHGLAVGLALLWNAPYLLGFYFATGTHKDAQFLPDPYQRNGVFARELQAKISAAPPGGYLYFPILRDHGDHYLLRAVLPDARVESVCEVPAEERRGRQVVLSKHTVHVKHGGEYSSRLREAGPRREEARARIVRQIAASCPLTGPEAGAGFSDWYVTLIPAGELDEERTQRWCAAFAAGREPRIMDEAAEPSRGAPGGGAQQR